MGLSPRARGNPEGVAPHGVQGGSIPACTGEPAGRQLLPVVPRVYPRVHGGTACAGAGRGYAGGLSPRARGNRISEQVSLPEQRSIPACTGEPDLDTLVLRPLPVYPRVHGGTWMISPQVVGQLGLSPRARGNRIAASTAPEGQRSIPACTGEPSTPRSRRRSRTVYPRVHGGTVEAAPGRQDAGGLSPRARGNRTEHDGVAPRAGSIPACTGEPALRRRSLRRRRVYPRVHGGTPATSWRPRPLRGLSPRARGNRTRP